MDRHSVTMTTLRNLRKIHQTVNVQLGDSEVAIVMLSLSVI